MVLLQLQVFLLSNVDSTFRFLKPQLYFSKGRPLYQSLVLSIGEKFFPSRLNLQIINFALLEFRTTAFRLFPANNCWHSIYSNQSPECKPNFFLHVVNGILKIYIERMRIIRFLRRMCRNYGQPHKKVRKISKFCKKK